MPSKLSHKYSTQSGIVFIWSFVQILINSLIWRSKTPAAGAVLNSHYIQLVGPLLKACKHGLIFNDRVYIISLNDNSMFMCTEKWHTTSCYETTTFMLSYEYIRIRVWIRYRKWI